MKKSTLFAKLPDYVATPDVMIMDDDVNLYIANFARMPLSKSFPTEQ